MSMKGEELRLEKKQEERERWKRDEKWMGEGRKEAYQRNYGNSKERLMKRERVEAGGYVMATSCWRGKMEKSKEKYHHIKTTNTTVFF